MTGRVVLTQLTLLLSIIVTSANTSEIKLQVYNFNQCVLCDSPVVLYVVCVLITVENMASYSAKSALKRKLEQLCTR